VGWEGMKGIGFFDNQRKDQGVSTISKWKPGIFNLNRAQR